MPLCTNISINGGNNNEGANFASYGFRGDWDHKRNYDSGRLSDYDSHFQKAGRENDINLDWRLVAAHAFIESGWKPQAKAIKGTAGGLYQFTDDTWKSCAPKGYKGVDYKYNPAIATQAYINLMTALLKQFRHAETRNDQILLALQSYHDGVIGGTTWVNVRGNDYTYQEEGRSYVPKIMEQYKRFGGSVS